MSSLDGFAQLAGEVNGLTVVATLHADATVQVGWQWAAVEGHDDCDAYDRTMLEQRRTAVLVHPLRAYSN